RVVMSAAFRDVKGLRTGAPVWFAGVQVGSVRTILLTPDERIITTMTIDKTALAYLKKDSTATIRTLGLLGDKYIELSMGSRDAPALMPEDKMEGMTLPEIGEELTQFVDRIESERGTLGRLIREDTLYRDLAASARDIRSFAKELKTSEGTLNKVISDPEVYQRFLKASESLDAFAKRLAESKGTMRRLIDDESLYVNMNAATLKLSAVLDRIDKGEGAMGSLIGDRELKEDLRSTVKELNELVKDIKKNPKRYFDFSIF
ncbi:MAG TPA: hypothetical protein DCS05_11550, partial [Nitrospiraceae bacterium]|nr:hypothetical protein [Nitrospiraceae bacterium]